MDSKIIIIVILLSILVNRSPRSDIILATFLKQLHDFKYKRKLQKKNNLLTMAPIPKSVKTFFFNEFLFSQKYR